MRALPCILLALVTMLPLSAFHSKARAGEFCGVAFPETTLVSVGTNPFSMAARDLDGDGDADIVTADATSLDVSILRNDGAGHLAREPELYVGARVMGTDAGDLDGDGYVDVVAGCTELALLAVSWGESGGGFSDATFVAAPQNPHEVRILDFDLDGRLDVLILSAAAKITQLEASPYSPGQVYAVRDALKTNAVVRRVGLIEYWRQAERNVPRPRG
jgi:FG-GAP-like repeat